MCLVEFETLLSECGGAIEFVEGVYQGVNPLEEQTSDNLREICQTLSKCVCLCVCINIYMYVNMFVNG